MASGLPSVLVSVDRYAQAERVRLVRVSFEMSEVLGWGLIVAVERKAVGMKARVGVDHLGEEVRAVLADAAGDDQRRGWLTRLTARWATSNSFPYALGSG
jgi:hypothetical protein